MLSERAAIYFPGRTLFSDLILCILRGVHASVQSTVFNVVSLGHPEQVTSSV